MSNCVFCAIADGIEPARIIRQWPDAVAFLPLNPVLPDGGHILVIPRRHVADAVEDPKVTATTMARAAELAAAHGASNILTSVGRAATQSVFHLHIHVIRRAIGDQLMVPWGTTGNPHDPHTCERAEQLDRALAQERQWRDEARAARDAANAELTQLRAGLHDEWGLRLSTHQPGDAKPYGRGDLGRWEACAAQQQWHEVVRREVTDWRDAADATPATAGTGATHTASGTEGGASVELEYEKPAAGQTEADGDRDPSAWCWAPNPDGPLHCGRLARHPGKHKRGEREWD